MKLTLPHIHNIIQILLQINCTICKKNSSHIVRQYCFRVYGSCPLDNTLEYNISRKNNNN